MNDQQSPPPGLERAYSEVVKKIGASPEVVFMVEKPPARRGRAEKHVLLGLFDHARRESLIAIVDPESQSLVDLQPTKAQFQLSEKERQEAERIAAQDGRVRKVLAGRAMNPLTRLYFPKQSGSGNRHAIVFLRPTGSERWFAIVDLTMGSVVEVISRQQLAGR